MLPHTRGLMGCSLLAIAQMLHAIRPTLPTGQMTVRHCLQVNASLLLACHSKCYTPMCVVTVLSAAHRCLISACSTVDCSTSKYIWYKCLPQPKCCSFCCFASDCSRGDWIASKHMCCCSEFILVCRRSSATQCCCNSACRTRMLCVDMLIIWQPLRIVVVVHACQVLVLGFWDLCRLACCPLLL